MLGTSARSTRPTATRIDPIAMTDWPPRRSMRRPTKVDVALDTSRPMVRPPKTMVWLQPVSAAMGLPSTPSA